MQILARAFVQLNKYATRVKSSGFDRFKLNVL